MAKASCKKILIYAIPKLSAPWKLLGFKLDFILYIFCKPPKNCDRSVVLWVIIIWGYEKEARVIGQDIRSMSQGSKLPYAFDNIPKFGCHGYQ